MTKKIYVDVFFSLLLHISEGTYHRQLVKFAPIIDVPIIDVPLMG